ncbi:hypothetical protein U1703_13390 [Sphingomonas sp. PB1R3]
MSKAADAFIKVVTHPKTREMVVVAVKAVAKNLIDGIGKKSTAKK